MTAQPAPVTPPPEWAVKAFYELMTCSNPSLTTEAVGAAIIARHAKEYVDAQDAEAERENLDRLDEKNAPPPAPSCTLVEALQEAIDHIEGEDWQGTCGCQPRGCPCKKEHDALMKRLQAALSRQPAPSADAARHKWSDEYIADLRARIASLEAELAEEQKEHRELYEQQLKMREALHNRDTHIAFLEAQLRAAPSAVAKDRADALAEITRWLATYKTGEVSLAHAADMIANLLSQPAVAQTEAVRERVIAVLVQFGLDGIRQTLADRILAALSESSPQSGSAPAVAGGGGDGARLDWLEKHANFIEVGHTDIGPTRIEIDAAIAATKAKEKP